MSQTERGIVSNHLFVLLFFFKLFGSFQLRGQVGVASSTSTNPNKNDTTQKLGMPSKRKLESSKIQSLNKLKIRKNPILYRL